jgi:hypothetical protein
LEPLLIENVKLKLSTKVQRCLSSPNKSKIELQTLIVIPSAPLAQNPMLAVRCPSLCSIIACCLSLHNTNYLNYFLFVKAMNDWRFLYLSIQDLYFKRQ